ncbi:hypothetical protein PO124_22770 [Bacillus licheniformis]|nr:hypothetical protein [Bacillus licheniformis]
MSALFKRRALMRKAEIYYGSRRRRDEHAARQKADVYSTGVGEAAEQARAGKSECWPSPLPNA